MMGLETPNSWGVGARLWKILGSSRFAATNESFLEVDVGIQRTESSLEDTRGGADSTLSRRRRTRKVSKIGGPMVLFSQGFVGRESTVSISYLVTI
jgi:hypothetical protein